MSLKHAEEGRTDLEVEQTFSTAHTPVPSIHNEPTMSSDAEKSKELSSVKGNALSSSDSDNLSQTGTVTSFDMSEKIRAIGTHKVEFTHKLPPPPKDIKGGYRKIRHFFFNVYRRLFSTVLILNFIGFAIQMIGSHTLRTDIRWVATAASANFCVAILARQEYIINTLFDVLVYLPKSTPLRIRRLVCKVYEFGGIHSGCSTSSVLWFIYLTALLTKNFINGSLRYVPLLALAYTLLMLFLSIVIFAYPALRVRVHDVFERTHRFAGWMANILFWTLIVLTAKALHNKPDETRSTGKILVSLPSFYLLSVNTVHAFVSWFRLRKIQATGIRLSNHALRLHLNAGIGQFYTIKISDNPLFEWHSFAVFPDHKGSVNGSTNSAIVSRAGDWTSKTIEEPKNVYYTRGFPTRGVLYMSLIFKRVVLVCTGSGIGPGLNLLTMKPHTRPSVRVLWSASRPIDTFSEEICESVLEADPNAVIWDTKKQGRPDLVAIAWQLAKESDAECVFCISNQSVTTQVVYDIESRGMPAFGPVFDS